MRRLLVGVVAMVLMLGSAPAFADPPEQSGPVFRFEVQGVREWGVSIQQDTYWVFFNITRESFCEWWADPSQPLPPAEEPVNSQDVVATDNQVGSLTGDVPIYFHSFEGENPLADPCIGSEAEPTLWGVVRYQVQDNDVTLQGGRANAFTYIVHGVVENSAGDSFLVSTRYQRIFSPDGTSSPVVVDFDRLIPMG